MTTHAPGRSPDARPAVLPAATRTDRATVRALVPRPASLRAVPRRRSAAAGRHPTERGAATVTRVRDISAGGIAAQVAVVVDPVARRWQGASLPEIRAVLSRAWWTAFGGPLDDPALAWCAEAIRDGRDWAPALWGTGP